MALGNFWKCVSAVLGAVALTAQTGQVLSIGTVPKVSGKRSAVVEARIPIVLEPSYHVNSNTPAEAYLIPLRLTWEKGPLEPVATEFPTPKLEKYDFSSKPVSVFTGNFEVVTKFRIASTAPSGPGIVLGKLRYQACSKTACLPPKSIEVRLPVQIR